MQRLLCVVIVLWSCATLAQAPCARVFRVPLDKVHEKAQPGYDVLTAVLEQMGCRIEKVYLSATNARHHRALAEGKLDVLAEASKLPERERYAWFSQPYREERVVLVVRQDHRAISGILQLSDIEKNKLKIIADEYSWWGEDVKSYVPRWKAAGLVVPVSHNGAEYRELMLKRADVLVTTDASFYIAQQQFPRLYINNPDIYREPVHFMFSRASVTRLEVDEFNQALQRYLANPSAP